MWETHFNVARVATVVGFDRSHVSSSKRELPCCLSLLQVLVDRSTLFRHHGYGNQRDGDNVWPSQTRK